MVKNSENELEAYEEIAKLSVENESLKKQLKEFDVKKIDKSKEAVQLKNLKIERKKINYEPVNTKVILGIFFYI